VSKFGNQTQKKSLISFMPIEYASFRFLRVRKHCLAFIEACEEQPLLHFTVLKVF